MMDEMSAVLLRKFIMIIMNQSSISNHSPNLPLNILMSVHRCGPQIWLVEILFTVLFTSFI